MSYPHLLDCQWCGGPHNGAKCPGCGMVELGYGSVYNQDPYSYHDTTSLFYQLPHHDTQTYLCEYCGGPHYSSDCQTGNTLVDEQVPDYNCDFSTHYSQPHQFYCCDFCGGPHFSSDCQTGNPYPCDNLDTPFYDQPPQYDMYQALLPEMQNMMKIVDELKGLVKDSAQRHTHQKSMEELLAEEQAARINSQDAYEKSVRESIAKEKAARKSSLFRFIPDDSDDEDTLDILQFYKDSSSSSVETPSVEIPSQSAVITPEVHTNSLIMGDQHLDTVPDKESDELIKSSVEILVPIPGESQGILEHLCDIPSPLECTKDQFEIFSDCSEDCASYGDIEFVEASVPHSDVDLLLEEFAGELTHINPLPTGSDDDLLDFEADLGEIESLLYHDPSLTSDPISPIENNNHFVPETFNTTLTNPLFEFNSEFTLTSDNPLFDVQNEDCDESIPEHEFIDSHLVNNSLHEEFSGELTHHIMTPSEFEIPGGDVLDHENLQIPTHPPGLFTSLTFDIQIRVNDPALEEEYQIMIFIMVFFLFFTYSVTSSLLHSFGSEDTIFDPGIFIYHL